MEYGRVGTWEVYLLTSIGMIDILLLLLMGFPQCICKKGTIGDGELLDIRLRRGIRN
jgi:hypothetical protein